MLLYFTLFVAVLYQAACETATVSVCLNGGIKNNEGWESDEPRAFPSSLALGSLMRNNHVFITVANKYCCYSCCCCKIARSA